MPKTIRVTLSHTTMTSISDGERMLPDGAVVTVSDEVADLFVAKKFGVFVDGSSAIAARQANKEADEERRIAARKMGADQRMQIWDSLPAEVRARANEEGDGVIEDYLAGLPSMPLDDYNAAPGEPFVEARDAAAEIEHMAAPKRRGRPPKIKPETTEGGDPA